MPRIFDNIELPLLPALEQSLAISQRADFCVGYFNLRGWQPLDSYVDTWDGGIGNCCRLLVGMQKAPGDEYRDAMRIVAIGQAMDNARVLRLKKQLAEEFRTQITLGFQTNADEAGLRKLADQLREKKVIVKLYLRHPLHAKLYLLYRTDPNNPITGFVGSSNLTFSGLQGQGELNVDVLDQQAAEKLASWFEDRWQDRWCIDISDELTSIIDESWARAEQTSPYQIYIKMAYHLSQEARAGLAEFRIPKIFGDQLFDYQTAAVKIAARHLHKRGGVLIGDVVGLGKTLMATALARIFEDDFGYETLILCPKNLVKMWDDYRTRYGLRGTVISTSRAIKELSGLKRYRLVLVDESHNLRNRDGKTYRAIREYIEKNDSHCILLSATPYNKSYLDLSAQLRLFIDDVADLGVRPEKLIRDSGEMWLAQRQISPRTISAFEQSSHADDWRELLRLYMVRRTRGFIQENYAFVECTNCGADIGAVQVTCPQCGVQRPHNARRYLKYQDGARSYFPERLPRTLKFNSDPQYAQLYSKDVIDTIASLSLPRYGLGNYINNSPGQPPSNQESAVIRDLSRAGKRLMGFCKTNLFKRLESSGESFLLSIDRHILRNYIFIYALTNGLPIPIGTQDTLLLNEREYDEDVDAAIGKSVLDDDGNDEAPEGEAGASSTLPLQSVQDYRQRAKILYDLYAGQFRKRFKWLPAKAFKAELNEDLQSDVDAMVGILDAAGRWDPLQDQKLAALEKLLRKTHVNEKVIVFTQFADTVAYLERELKNRGMENIAGVTGQSSDPTAMAWRFSPESAGKRNEVSEAHELRVLVATDVLSEGQNLQDSHIVVNYDLPWAIIRLIQRAGRVDRIGQNSDTIRVYSALPAKGVDGIIFLRSRLKDRLKQNAEVVGTDELFFEDDNKSRSVVELYNEKSGILDDDSDNEIDLSSYAYQIWQNAIMSDPSLQKKVPGLPSVIYSTRNHQPSRQAPSGVLVYLQSGHDNDALAWVDVNGKSVTESQYAILRAAECAPDTQAVPRHEQHHDLVRRGVELIVNEEHGVGGALGKPSGARYKTYERLMRYAGQVRGGLFDRPELHRAIEELYKYPLAQAAADKINTHLRNQVSDEMLAELVILLRDENRLCVVTEGDDVADPRVLCSLGLSEGV